MREEVLVPDEVVDLIADLAALCAAEVLAGRKEGAQVVVERAVDGFVGRGNGGLCELLERAIVEVVGEDAADLLIYDFALHYNGA